MNIKITITSFLIASALLICAWLLLGKGCVGPSHKADAGEVKEIIKTVYAADLTYKVLFDSLNSVVAVEKRKTDSISKAKHAIEVQLTASRIKINTLIAANQNVKIRRDTILYYDNCDSLAASTESLLQTVDYLQENNQAMASGYVRQLNGKDSIISLQMGQYSFLRGAFADVTDKYAILNKDYLKANRQVKTQRTITRILGGAVIVLSGILIAK